MTERYNRQEKVKKWNQESLKKGSVVIIGAGALGNFIAPVLAGYGIGEITIYDDDTVELHNLARQIMFREKDAADSAYKCKVLERELQSLNSEIIVRGYEDRIDEDNIGFLINPAKTDVLIDCVDNVQTRGVLNKFALEQEIPLVHMGSSPTGGQIGVITRETACLECMMDLTVEDADSCRDVVEPSIGETNAVIGSLGAGQVRMLLMDKYSEMMPRDKIIQPMLYYKIGRSPIPFNHIAHAKVEDCEVCSKYK